MKDELPPNTIIGHQYRVVETLGRGGFGITYKCEDIHLKFIVAVKEYFPEGMAERNPESFDVLATAGSDDLFAWGLKKFLLEGTTLAAIQHKYSSEFIVKIMRYWKEHQTAYLAMEFIDGMQIDDFATSHRITSAKQVEGIFQSLCLKALKPIHDSNFYHRDIKPANILVRHSNSEPVIIDFGAARQTAGGKSTVALLTPRYSAVEQYASQEDMDDDGGNDLCGSFTDIYSLAATFYFIIKGQPPQDAPSRLLSNNSDILAGDDSLSDYSGDFLRQIDWGMEPIPKDRPQTIDEWLQPTASMSKVKKTKADASKKAAKKQIDDSIKTSSSGHKMMGFDKNPVIAGIAAVALFFWVTISYNIYESKEAPQPIVALPPTIGIDPPKPVVLKPKKTSWIVGIESAEWTPINVLPEIKRLRKKPNGSYQLKLYADEPFRVKTEKGLAVTKADAQSFGGINGEVFLKSVSGNPQKVTVEIIQTD
ncbi:MAG TPA: hypothetical protein DCL66_03515 [Gammaproteobacteria bacterium]|nr:hypothetical protein [Gammaproteobacteria bacterium]|tara:strand:- start:449 stop:1885 length:1437 start_codon:yes stop_codon:yes gene_type:complete